MGSPLVSVVIPCYKCEGSIERAVLSVIKQTYENWEIILVEDCSNDNNKTKNKLQNLKDTYSEYPIHLYFLDKNGGPSVARNKGMNAAKGEYIAFLDADDSWYSNKLFIQVNIMLSNKKYVLSSHKDEVFTGIEKKVDYKKVEYKEITFKQMLFSNRISTRTVLIHKTVKHRFDENMRYSEDFRLWMEIIGDGYKALYIDEVLASSYKARYGEDGLSARLWNMEKGELSTFKYLKSKNKINVITYRITRIWSFIKYLRRLFLVNFQL